MITCCPGLVLISLTVLAFVHIARGTSTWEEDGYIKGDPKKTENVKLVTQALVHLGLDPKGLRLYGYYSSSSWFGQNIKCKYRLNGEICTLLFQKRWILGVWSHDAPKCKNAKKDENHHKKKAKGEIRVGIGKGGKIDKQEVKNGEPSHHRGKEVETRIPQQKKKETQEKSEIEVPQFCRVTCYEGDEPPPKCSSLRVHNLKPVKPERDGTKQHTIMDKPPGVWSSIKPTMRTTEDETETSPSIQEEKKEKLQSLRPTTLSTEKPELTSKVMIQTKIEGDKNEPTSVTNHSKGPQSEGERDTDAPPWMDDEEKNIEGNIWIKPTTPLIEHVKHVSPLKANGETEPISLGTTQAATDTREHLKHVSPSNDKIETESISLGTTQPATVTRTHLKHVSQYTDQRATKPVSLGTTQAAITREHVKHLSPSKGKVETKPISLGTTQAATITREHSKHVSPSKHKTKTKSISLGATLVAKVTREHLKHVPQSTITMRSTTLLTEQPELASKAKIQTKIEGEKNEPTSITKYSKGSQSKSERDTDTPPWMDNEDKNIEGNIWNKPTTPLIEHVKDVSPSKAKGENRPISSGATQAATITREHSKHVSQSKDQGETKPISFGTTQATVTRVHVKHVSLSKDKVKTRPISLGTTQAAMVTRGHSKHVSHSTIRMRPTIISTEQPELTSKVMIQTKTEGEKHEPTLVTNHSKGSQSEGERDTDTPPWMDDEDNIWIKPTTPLTEHVKHVSPSKSKGKTKPIALGTTQAATITRVHVKHVSQSTGQGETKSISLGTTQAAVTREHVIHVSPSKDKVETEAISLGTTQAATVTREHVKHVSPSKDKVETKAISLGTTQSATVTREQPLYRRDTATQDATTEGMEPPTRQRKVTKIRKRPHKHRIIRSRRPTKVTNFQ